MKTAMIGNGAWGRAMARVLARNGHEVRFITREQAAWPVDYEPDYIFLALPCQVIRERLSALRLPTRPVISLTKGIEVDTGLRVSEIVVQVAPGCPTAVVSGPSLAIEVERESPTAVVAAAASEDLAREVQELLHQKMFRVYRSTDLPGVELGGALKNVYAIAGGICEGLRMGENGLAGLTTRSLAEMVRLACTLGAKKETLFGLSGMGDLVLTSYSGHSRNHRVGELVAVGRTLDDVLSHLGGVAEGVPTAKALSKVAAERGIRAPVIHEVYRVLYEGKPPLAAFHDLMIRQADEE
jgi:glycerol-3-phosphate dehydrogenase (NAD(P)+)